MNKRIKEDSQITANSESTEDVGLEKLFEDTQIESSISKNENLDPIQITSEQMEIQMDDFSVQIEEFTIQNEEVQKIQKQEKEPISQEKIVEPVKKYEASKVVNQKKIEENLQKRNFIITNSPSKSKPFKKKNKKKKVNNLPFHSQSCTPSYRMQYMPDNKEQSSKLNNFMRNNFFNPAEVVDEEEEEALYYEEKAQKNMNPQFKKQKNTQRKRKEEKQIYVRKDQAEEKKENMKFEQFLQEQNNFLTFDDKPSENFFHPKSQKQFRKEKNYSANSQNSMSIENQNGMSFQKQNVNEEVFYYDQTFGNHFANFEQIKDLIAAVQILPQHQFSQMANLINDSEQQDIQHQSNEEFFEQLQQEMLQNQKDVQIKLDSVRKEREEAISIIEKLVKETFQTTSNLYVGVKMYGSMASGLAIESSDVDLAVTGLSFGGNRERQINYMRELEQRLQFVKCKSYLQFIDSATIPLIKVSIDLQLVSKFLSKFDKGEGHKERKLDDTLRYLGIDITFEDYHPIGQIYEEINFNSNKGIQCISFIQKLCMDFPDLKPIVLVLKKLLQKNNFNCPYYGGLSSYSLVLMVATFLNTSNSGSMSKNLQEFLNYFSNYFDPMVIGMDGKQIIFLNFRNLFQLVNQQADPVVVIDPLNRANNTTRTAFRFYDIQELFRNAHSILINSDMNFQKETSKINILESLLRSGESNGNLLSRLL